MSLLLLVALSVVAIAQQSPTLGALAVLAFLQRAVEGVQRRFADEVRPQMARRPRHPR